MSSSPRKTADRAGKTLRWRRYGALLAALLVIYAVDRYLKSGDAAGILPESATWRLEAANLPEAWARWQESPTYGALRKKAPGALQAVAVSIRKMTGIRPTPSRIQFWLGDGALVGGGPDGWCLSVRPGLALRAASLLATPPLKPKPGEEPFWQGYASGWRDGFFLVASSADYLNEVMASGQAVPPGDRPGDSLALAWEGEHPGTAAVRVQPGLPVHVELPQTGAPPEAAIFGAGEGEGVMLSLSIHGAGVPRFFQQAANTVLKRDSAAPAWEAAMAVASDWWAAYCPLAIHPLPEVHPWGLDVVALDFRPDIPTMELIGVDGGPQGGLWSRLPDSAAQEHRWNDTEGWLVPVPDAARAWAIAETPAARIVTSHEHLMPLALQVPKSRVEGAAAQLELQWQPFARALVSLARRAADEELLPGMNRDDVSQDVVPVLEGLGGWGTFELHLYPEGGGLRGEGYLARDAGQR